MKILTRLNHLKQLLETSPLDTVLDEMYHLVNSEQVLFMEFDRFVRSESVNTLLYDRLEGNAYGWMSVTH